MMISRSPLIRSATISPTATGSTFQLGFPAWLSIRAESHSAGRGEQGQRSGQGKEGQPRSLWNLDLGRDVFHEPPREGSYDEEGDDVCCSIGSLDGKLQLLDSEKNGSDDQVTEIGSKGIHDTPRKGASGRLGDELADSSCQHLADALRLDA